MIGRLLVPLGIAAAALACRDGGRSTATATLADTADQVLSACLDYVAARVCSGRGYAPAPLFLLTTQTALLRNVHRSINRWRESSA